ncbi:MAG TPA: ATPase domain-containing protein, partial [Thermoanaerobaculia bacterium]
MARKYATVFSCTACGAQSPQWIGRCPECGAWSTLVEEPAVDAPPRGGAISAFSAAASSSGPVRLGDVAAAAVPRIPTGIADMDRVLGGGLVPGSVVLVGGEPGIGKSTLMLQVAARLSDRLGSVLYVSAEESAQQV